MLRGDPDPAQVKLRRRLESEIRELMRSGFGYAFWAATAPCCDLCAKRNGEPFPLDLLMQIVGEPFCRSPGRYRCRLEAIHPESVGEIRTVRFHPSALGWSALLLALFAVVVLAWVLGRSI